MKRNHWKRGASLPETVIVMSVLMFLLLGIIDFGRALYTYSFVAQTARQSARWLIVRGTNCTVVSPCNATNDNLKSYAQSLSIGATNASNISASATSTQSGCGTAPPFAPGCAVTVTVTYPFNFMFPFLPTGISMSSSSTMQQAN